MLSILSSTSLQSSRKCDIRKEKMSWRLKENAKTFFYNAKTFYFKRAGVFFIGSSFANLLPLSMWKWGFAKHEM